MMNEQDKLQAMEDEMAILTKKMELVPSGSIESTLLSASMATLQQQIEEMHTA